MATSRTKPHLVLVCSSPSRVAELERLRAWWSGESRQWIAPDTPEVRSLLTGEDWSPSQGVLGNVGRLAGVLGRRDQLVVVDTGPEGAAAALVARLRRTPTMVIESPAEPSRSLSRRLARRTADRVLTRWPEPTSESSLKFVNVGGVS